ncbi:MULTISPECIES: hypothetical protein [Acidithrix]|uniref:Uncharacterized protein n=1 Tax=Acidithrix ferrooxidans TaxID=1280514 RepID=A0A0D8HI49_9ACTN|nr:MULTISPECIES: hypothetical protein [Acidithrix]KJF17665.1 hypothetical protein AXFE_14600 [Acidithrix ferrooxidans]CAG4903469.1 unnamed protein product [Acidithrix sp. C25]
MSVEITTRDCSLLSDGELDAMAELVASSEVNLDFGYLSKAREEWVLVTEVKVDGRLRGFSFYTLERIGGTPAIIIGALVVERGPQARETLYRVREGQFKKALLAFPDEDVLMGSKLLDVGAFEIFEDLEDIVPKPGHKPTGEERAWARRLARRYGSENRVDDRTFIFSGTGEITGYSGYEPAVRSSVYADFADFFTPLESQKNDSLIAFGWIMAEELAKFVATDD